MVSTKDPVISVIRPGEAKANPFAVIIIASPALEGRIDSGNFIEAISAGLCAPQHYSAALNHHERPWVY